MRSCLRKDRNGTHGSKELKHASEREISVRFTSDNRIDAPTPLEIQSAVAIPYMLPPHWRADSGRDSKPTFSCRLIDRLARLVVHGEKRADGDALLRSQGHTDIVPEGGAVSTKGPSVPGSGPYLKCGSPATKGNELKRSSLVRSRTSK